MEILNSIWSILTTENETLTKLIVFLSSILEAYFSLLLFTTPLNINYTKFQKYIYIFAATIFNLVVTLILPSPINILANYIFLFFVVSRLFKLSPTKAILAIIIPFCSFAIIGTLILNPIIKIFDIDSNLLNKVPLYRCIYLSISYILAYLLIYIFKLKNTKIKLSDDLNHHNKIIMTINLLLGTFTLIIELIITIFYTNVLPVYITFLSSISLIFYFLISFYSLTHIVKLQKTTLDLENAENYNNTLSILYDNVKGFKHDFNNMLHMMGGYIKTNDMEGLKKYYSELENDCEKLKNLAMLNPNTINNPGIYNLLMVKYKKANELNIKINLEYFFDFEKLHMPIYQFSRMLGILLDNAIEASSMCDEKQINIIFRDSPTNRTQIITIENTYSNKDIDTSKIFEKGVSEKKDHMGMGLWEVNQILMKNNNIKLITTNDDTYFKQQLEIYY